jgi:hypothetical protein
MAIKWPENWMKLLCQQGHELHSYDKIVEGEVYCRCDVCGWPCAFNNIPLKGMPFPSRVRLITDKENYNDIPPVKEE